ncbi:MAG: DEAD/DEAH box helicase [Nocardioidaceae bacterium]
MPVDDRKTPPTASCGFSDLGLGQALVTALKHGGIIEPTPVQTAVLPDAISGRDVLGRAATGSGKTLAFGLPILARLSGGRSVPKSPRALIVVPTRELAGQVRSHLEPLADAVCLRLATVYGGTPYDRQVKRLRAGVDIVVATPGRLQDLVDRGACRLDRVEITVLDEADHLCDLGFFPAVSKIVSLTPPGGQRLLLSATLDGDVDRLVRTHLSDPITHDCDPDSEQPDMQHHVLVTSPADKLESLAELLRANPRSIVFTRTRHGATNLARRLVSLGVTTVDLHGSLSQNARERNLGKFRAGQADVVVATDVAARGIHVDGVALVVHYDAPTEHKSYLHRSGRTARAGQSGHVVTMTTGGQATTVARLHRTAGVTARHHDARTAPRPMTAAALSESGLPASLDGVGTTAQRPDGRSEVKGRRDGSRRRTVAARTRAKSERGPRRPAPSRTDPASHLTGGTSSSRSAARASASQPAARRESAPARRGTTGKSGRSKKQRWTASEKRARSQR